jgi:outer membrane protein assembly factor BamE (lipoprotein component of BamABCDE complex)
MIMRRTAGVLLSATIPCLALSGCSLAMAAPVVVDGKSFPRESVSELKAGMPPRDVEALLGTPLQSAQTGDRLTWTYDFRRQLRECHMELFGIPLEPIRSERHSLELVFLSSGLQRAVYRQYSPQGGSESVLVGAGRGSRGSN